MKQDEIFHKLNDFRLQYGYWQDQQRHVARWIDENFQEKQNPKEDERKKIAAIIYARLLDQYGLIPIQETYKMKEIAIKAALMTDILLEEINNKSNG